MSSTAKGVNLLNTKGNLRTLYGEPVMPAVGMVARLGSPILLYGAPVEKSDIIRFLGTHPEWLFLVTHAHDAFYFVHLPFGREVTLKMLGEPRDFPWQDKIKEGMAFEVVGSVSSIGTGTVKHGEASREEVVRLDDESEGDSNERLRDGDVPEASAGGLGDWSEASVARRQEEGEAPRVPDEDMAKPEDSDNLDVARASYRYAAETLERRATDRACPCGRHGLESCPGWQTAISIVRGLDRMGK